MSEGSIGGNLQLPHKSQNLTGVCVSLDALLDTRIGTVAKIGGDDLALQVLAGNYHARQDDKFPGVNVDAYQKVYANRDVETLALSTVTKVIDLLRETLISLMKQAVVRPFHEGVRLVVNTYPYALTNEETQLVLKMMAIKLNVLTKLDVPLRFEAIHKSDEELTPEYCTANFSALIMYDYEQWLIAQQQALIKKPIPEVTLYAPALYFVQTPTEEQLAELKTQFNWSPFEAIEKTVRGGLFLQLLPAEVFSVVKPS